MIHNECSGLFPVIEFNGDDGTCYVSDDTVGLVPAAVVDGSRDIGNERRTNSSVFW